MDGPRAVIADYECSALRKTIENGYDGPRTVGNRELRNFGEDSFPLMTSGSAIEKTQAALAATYYRVRTGRSVFGGLSEEEPSHSALCDAHHRVRAYLSSRSLDLSLLSHAGERAALARALAVDPGERFSSCVEFVKCLASGADGVAEGWRALNV